ncbi:MAG: iron-sulfur cluster assembly scaffold protein [Proteobacteria bacterium]|nr:iron-sulfur cluster assembly scaffold protein [Pseudomonadota bacterium]
MSDEQANNLQDPRLIREMLLGSGYSEKAVDLYLTRPNMGSLPDANQVSELTGHCGDTMKIFLKIEDNVIQDAKIQVLGCPGAVASAMATMDMIRGKTLEEAATLRDADVFKVLEDLPDQKQHCIRLSVKTLQKAIEDYSERQQPAAKEIA